LFFPYPRVTHFAVTQLRLQDSSTRDNALHDVKLIKLTVARFVGTGGFVTRYSNGHKK